jgi:hypothetical protein
LRFTESRNVVNQPHAPTTRTLLWAGCKLLFGALAYGLSGSLIFWGARELVGDISSDLSVLGYGAWALALLLWVLLCMAFTAKTGALDLFDLIDPSQEREKPGKPPYKQARWRL